MELSVTTPEGAVFTGACDSVTLFAHDGSLGILPGHAPLVTELGIGPLEILQGDQREQFYLEGGYLQVLDNKITVLATRARRVPEAAT